MPTLLTLQKIIQEVNVTNDLLEAMRIVVRRVRQAVNADACSVYFFDEKASSYRLVASNGFKDDDVQFLLGKNQGLVSLIAEREEPLNLQNAKSHRNYVYFPETGEELFEAFLGAPIIHKGKVLGVLVVQQKEKRCYDTAEESFIVTVCAQLSSKIAHAEVTIGMPWKDGEPSLVSQDTVLSGFPVSPGVSLGHLVLVYPHADLDAVPTVKSSDTKVETNRFTVALDKVKLELTAITANLAENISEAELAIFDAYSHMLDDNSLGGEVIQVIQQGYAAPTALKKVVNKHVRAFNEMDDEYLRERSVDLKDIGRRVLKYLQQVELAERCYPEDTILLGEEVTASLLAEVPGKHLKGIVSVQGSKNSHVAILARALGVPVVMGADGIDISCLDGKEVIVDGYNGRVQIAPNEMVKQEFIRLIAEDEALYAGLSDLADVPAVTTDDYETALYVNTGLLAEASSSLERGAQGVGLYRTEVPFLVRDRFPTEKEQLEIYKSVLQFYQPMPVTMRTLDIGGDKMLPYFPVKEENPFLGWRGIRISLDHPELFLVQLRAMLKANVESKNLRLMLPMVCHLAEIKEAKKFLNQAYQELMEEGIPVDMPQLGVMIEVPAIAYQVKALAKEVDFISVGTNDLTQYLLAVDRNNERVAYLYESLHPAVLSLLQTIVTTAKQSQVPVTVCGEMASDPAAVILLIAIGFDGLSLNSSSLLTVKWVIRSFSLEKARQLLELALELESATEVRKLMERALDEAGLGGLTRAGK